MGESWFGPQPKGRRKVSRPFSPGRPIEARWTSRRARGEWSLVSTRHASLIRELLQQEARRCGVRLVGIESGEAWLQLRLTASRRDRLAEYLRVVGGRVPRLVTGAERARPLPERSWTGTDRKFWDGLVATRILDARVAR